MKDRIFYLTLGVLVGVIVMQWGVIRKNGNTPFNVPPASAGVVIDDTGIIAITGGHDTQVFLLDEFGQKWEANAYNDPCWQLYRYPLECANLPVPVSEMKFWTGRTIVTHNNELWQCKTEPENPPMGWRNCGQWPGGPVETSPSTWGNVKGKYEGDN